MDPFITFLAFLSLLVLVALAILLSFLAFLIIIIQPNQLILSGSRFINQQLLNYKKRRLQKLKEQRALSGPLADPKIHIEIEDLEKEIEDLEDKLG